MCGKNGTGKEGRERRKTPFNTSNDGGRTGRDRRSRYGKLGSPDCRGGGVWRGEREEVLGWDEGGAEEGGTRGERGRGRG